MKGTSKDQVTMKMDDDDELQITSDVVMKGTGNEQFYQNKWQCVNLLMIQLLQQYQQQFQQRMEHKMMKKYYYGSGALDHFIHIKHLVELLIIKSNDWELDSQECGAAKLFLSEIVERTFNPFYVHMTLITHALNGEIEDTRSDLLAVIDGLNYSNFGDYVDNSDAFEIAVQGSLAASGVDKKIVVLSFCEADSNDGDDTCLIQEIRDPCEEVEIIVINVGGGGINNQFDCLTSGSGGNLFNINEIDEDVLINSSPDIEREICKRGTNSPTKDPTERPSPSPTDAPTSQPTNDPTQRPSPSPTDSPTGQPTDDPTEQPSPSPTDAPTSQPTNDPTSDVCDYDFTLGLGIVVSNGCRLSENECDSARMYLSKLVEKVYDESFVLFFRIYLHDFGSRRQIGGSRDNVLDIIDSNFNCRLTGH